MKLYIGIDLGTSAAKLLLMDAQGSVLNIVSKEYPLEFPQPGWSQQAPEDWKKAVLEGIPELLRGFDADAVAGIGCGGQMHGLVVLDETGALVGGSISPGIKISMDALTVLLGMPEYRGRIQVVPGATPCIAVKLAPRIHTIDQARKFVRDCTGVLANSTSLSTHK